MKKDFAVVTAFVCLLVGPTASAAVRGDKAMYVGGTVSSIAEKTMGRFDVSDGTAAVFLDLDGKTLLEIPYDKITSIEYGQKAGRRVGVAIVVTWIALFSKKRKHFVTLGFTDPEGKQQGVVFELAKGQNRKVLTVLEARSGKPVEYESEDARKHVD